MVEVHRLLGASESIGIEYAPDLVGAASDLPRGCRLVQGDVTAAHPEVAAGSFDFVTALAVLEHVDDLGAVGRQVMRALRPGGIFVASCPAPTWDRVSGSLGLHKDEHHTVAMDRKGFTDFAKVAGLEPLLYQPFMFAPVGFLPYAGIKVSPALAAGVDALLRPIPLSGLLMVNQLFVARRPEGK
jgi:SAM-dependent methyltransferase